jgi:hypothetical protein
MANGFEFEMECYMWVSSSFKKLHPRDGPFRVRGSLTADPAQNLWPSHKGSASLHCKNKGPSRGRKLPITQTFLLLIGTTAQKVKFLLRSFTNPLVVQNDDRGFAITRMQCHVTCHVTRHLCSNCDIIVTHFAIGCA